jgi:hypothetical protein
VRGRPGLRRLRLLPRSEQLAQGFRCPGCGREPAQVITISYMSDDDPRMQRAAASAVAEPEAAPEPPTPVSTEKTQAEVLAEVHAAIAALAAERPAAEPEPESESGEDAPQDARPLPGWGPTHRRTTARPSPPSRYRWR